MDDHSPFAMLRIETVAQAAALFRAALPKVQKDERVFVLPLDGNGKVLAKPILVSVGHEDGTAAIDAGAIFREAPKAGAEEIIIAHNHPSGDPTPSKADMTAVNDGTFHAGGGNVVTGANMRFADALPGDHVVIKDGEGHDVEAMISTDDEVPVTESRFGLNIDEGTPLTEGEEYTFEFSMMDADGQPVTVTKTARWNAS